MNCPLYQDECILKHQVQLPNFKNDHDCLGNVNQCSFLLKEKLKQVESNLKVKIIIKQLSNCYAVKADALIFPANNLLEIDDPVLNKMTLHKAQQKCKALLNLNKEIKMGYPYVIECEPSWKNQQKYIINAVVAGASRLVNEKDIIGAMKKSLLLADEMGLQRVLITPADNGVHDISLTSMNQLSSIFTLAKSYDFKNIKSIYICMEDEESEQCFIEYYNRIFGERNEQRNEDDSTINN